MFRRILPGFILMITVSGCFKVGPKSDEDIHQQLIKQYDELNTVLLKIHDEGSAKDRLPRIKKIGDRLKELKLVKDEHDRHVPTPQSEAIKKKYGATLGNSIRRVVNQFQRLRQVTPGTKSAADEMEVLLQQLGINGVAPVFKSGS